jgi:hypothetical protein
LGTALFPPRDTVVEHILHDGAAQVGGKSSGELLAKDRDPGHGGDMVAESVDADAGRDIAGFSVDERELLFAIAVLCVGVGYEQEIVRLSKEVARAGWSG